MMPMHPDRRAGFTLFEMIVVVGIFVLLAGGIYATVNASIRATATVSEENLEMQRLDAFISLLRRTLHNLPATAKVSGGVSAEGGDGLAELVLRESPGAFDWGAGGPPDATVMLVARPRLGGGREISLLQLPASQGEMERRDRIDSGDWLRLLPDLRSVRWRFYDASVQDWLDEWRRDDRPPLVELSLEFLGERGVRQYIFWLPPVAEPSSPPPVNGDTNPNPEAPPGE
jgi:prepilin-type N-terminal cleavage/methylation domain-containing protein